MFSIPLLMEKGSTASQDFSGIPLIFIHSSLDDAEVSVSAFRVYGHIARRANRDREAFPGIDSMSRICRMAKGTVVAAIRELEARKMLVVERYPGKTTHYRLTNHEDWAPCQNVERFDTMSIEVTHPCQNGERTMSKCGTKGIPSKDIQEGNPILRDLPGQTFLFGEEEPRFEKSKSGDIQLAFETFWRAYPKRKGKDAALTSFKRKKCALKIEVILKALELQKQSEQWEKQGGQFIPYPATWLNQGRWEDELEVPSERKTSIATGVAALKNRKP